MYYVYILAQSGGFVILAQSRGCNCMSWSDYSNKHNYDNNISNINILIKNKNYDNNNNNNHNDNNNNV